MAPSLVGSPRVNGHRDYVIKTLLHGLTGPIEGKAALLESAGNGTLNHLFAEMLKMQAGIDMQHVADTRTSPPR